MPASLDVLYDKYVAAEKLKSGTKFERMAAIVFKILNESSTVQHDVRLRGDGKTAVHQIDVTVSGGGVPRKLVIECRDKDTPIGLGAVRDFNGAVIQLDADSFLLAASRFTSPAQKYALDEAMQLGTLRPFREEDWEGRVRKIVLHLTAFVRQDAPQVELRVDEPSDASDLPVGLVHVSNSPTVAGGGSIHDIVNEIIGAWPMREGDYEVVRKCDPPLKVGGATVREIVVTYSVRALSTEIEIESESVPELLIRTLDGTVDQVITAADLQRFGFDGQGVVIPRLNGPSVNPLPGPGGNPAL